MDGWRAERIAGGQYIVRAAADSRRLGFVVGGRRRWAAEVGPATIGYFSSRAAACRAIAAHASGRAQNGENLTMNEYVVWGVPPDGDGDERPLYTRAETMEQARRVMRVLEEKHGCTRLRVQVLDLAEPPDFVRAALARP